MDLADKSQTGMHKDGRPTKCLLLLVVVAAAAVTDAFFKGNQQPATALGAPEFSHAPGFYSNKFLLTLQPPQAGAAIRYTLDGSEPTVTSPLYEGPLVVSDRSRALPKLATIRTATQFQTSLGPAFQGTVVRARAFQQGLPPSPIETRSYFVHPKGRSRYTVPVISLVTAPKHFFDPKTGIYVPGFRAEGNYSQRGKESTRPVHVELLETNGTVIISQDASAKIHGNSSRQFVIKGLDLDARTGESESFRGRLFPDRARDVFKHLLLRASGHDQGLAYMRDELLQSLAAEFGAETQASRLVVLFINGEFWGLHYLKEKEDADFLAYYGNTSPKQLDYLEDYAVARIGDTQHYDAMLRFARDHDLSEAAHYARMQAFMDVPNYIDYKAAEIFSYRWDIGNHRLWRPHRPDGRWRWLQFDNDVGWGGFWSVPEPWSFDMLQAVSSASESLYGHNDAVRTFLFTRLLKNESFTRYFIVRFSDLLNTVYAPEHTLARIGQFAAALEPEMTEHTARWHAPDSIEAWHSQVQLLHEFARRRPEFMRQHLMRKFSLPGTARLTVSIRGNRKAALLINTVQVLVRSDTSWTGTYFRGVPLTLSVNETAGLDFKRWEGMTNSLSPIITLLPSDDVNVTAVFEHK